MNMGKKVLYLISLLLPWILRRLVLVYLFKYEIHPTSKIGFSWITPTRLILGPQSRIGNLNVAKGLELLVMDECAIIGNLNWITGFPLGDTRHYSNAQNRKVELHLHEHSAITNRHLLDCTDRVSIGAYATLAGFHSQLLTHSIDLQTNAQSCRPITIGAYCFIGTHCVILGGSALPDHCVLGAHSLLEKEFDEAYKLYGGVPARPLKGLEKSMAYFTRQTGYVD